MKSPTTLIKGGLLAASLMAFAPLAALADDVSIRLGHVLPESHSWHVAATGFAEEVNNRTEGRVAIKVFPSGQLGSEKEVIEGLQFGSVQAGLIGSGSFQGIEPRMGIIEMPYAWGARDQAFAALDGDLGVALADMLDGKGIKVLGWWENGFRNITNNVRPVEKPEDLAGLKIRVTPDKVRLATFEGLGAEPAPLSFGELYSALQQGLFDAQENPLALIKSANFNEVQDYVNLTQHVRSWIYLTISDMAWNKMSEEDQQAVMEAASRAQTWEREQFVAEETELQAQLEELGMEFVEVDNAAFAAAAKEAVLSSVSDEIRPQVEQIFAD